MEPVRMHDDLVRDAVSLGDDPQLRLLLQEVCQATGMGFAAVARVTEDRWIAAHVLDRIAFGLGPGDELAIATTICNDIRACGEAVVIDDIAGRPEWRTHAAPMLYGFKSYVSLPLFGGDGRFWGTLCAIDPEPHAVSALSLVETLQGYARRAERIVATPG